MLYRLYRQGPRPNPSDNLGRGDNFALHCKHRAHCSLSLRVLAVNGRPSCFRRALQQDRRVRTSLHLLAQPILGVFEHRIHRDIAALEAEDNRFDVWAMDHFELLVSLTLPHDRHEPLPATAA